MTPPDPYRRPYSIRIFLAEGTPSGLKFVEKSNWTSVGVVCPRPRFTSVKVRKEFTRAGVYVLIGPSDASDRPLVYIGEGDPIRTRLEDHHSRKDFWTVAYFDLLVSLDEGAGAEASVEAAWAAEIARRSDEVHRGTAKLVDMDVALNRVRRAADEGER